MKIDMNEDVREEVLDMTKEVLDSQERNGAVNNCVAKRPIVPFDDEKLLGSCESIGAALQGEASEVLPLLIVGRQIGLDGIPLMGFIADQLDYITIYKAAEIKENPYYKKISISRTEDGPYILDNVVINKGEVFLDREPESWGYQRYNHLGVFDDGSLENPALYENGRCWMSITPNEIVTMKESIANAHGKVLTLGLGLGYYAYMTHIKDDVESVTIVEYEQKVIDIFTQNILPQFDHSEKINIIKGDAIKYFEELEDGAFDYCFADIWQNPEDGINDYLALKLRGNKFKKMECSYWIEESFIGYLEEHMAAVIQYSCLGDDDSEMMKNIGYSVMKKLTENEEIKYPEDIQDMFGGEFIREVLAGADETILA